MNTQTNSQANSQVNFRLNHTCLISGATRGIGRAIALALGAHGAIVVGTATSADGAAQIDAALKQADIKGAGLVMDVTDDDSIARALEVICAKFGAPEVLVNNAGITRDNLLMRMSEAQWDEVLDANLKSVYRMTRACLRPMSKARFGRIINIASVVGASGNAGQSNYAAAKAGMLGFTKALAREVASRNITVNAIAPGFIETDMTAELAESQRDALRAQIPLARLGAPDDVAAAAVFLASSGGGYITGATLHVNGGMLMA